MNAPSRHFLAVICSLAASVGAAGAVPQSAPVVADDLGELPPERILEAVPRLADSDPRVRLAAVRALARPDLLGASLPERVVALGRSARRDPDEGVRAAAIRALGAVGNPGASAELVSLILEGREGARVAAAEALVAAPAGVQGAVDLVRAALGGAGSSAPVRLDALAVLLPRYAQWLADARAVERADYVPLLLGLAHPDNDLRSAAVRSFDALLARLADSGDPGRAAALLGELQRLGIERDVALYQRARISLGTLGDANEALQVAGGLVASRGVRLRPEARIDAYESQLWVFRGHHLSGLALLALGRFDEGADQLDRAALALDRALAERRDLLSDAERVRHVDLLHQRALSEVARTLAAVARGAETPIVLERARAAHRIHLEAQAVFAELRGDVVTGWDGVLRADLSPYRLLFGRRGFGASGEAGVARSTVLEWQQQLGRALATVAPGELPGFQPLPPGGAMETWLDPLVDPSRRALLERIREARLSGIDEAIDEAESALLRARQRSMGVLPEDEVEALERLRRQRFAALRANQDEDRSDGRWARDLRVPGSAALWFAQDLTEEGRGTEARVIATRLESDVRARGISDWWFFQGHDMIARSQLMAGSAFTDEGNGVRAAEVLLRAVQGIEDIERDLGERGASERDLAPFRDLRASALVSLAVNANVRLGDSQEALGYYERAYALRKDEFMRTLMACYKARAGAESEARDLLRTIRPAPGTWYNLACTHALLGDTDRALDYLEAELSRNHASTESANRQRAWATGDPDLASLREVPRFQRLVRPR